MVHRPDSSRDSEPDEHVPAADSARSRQEATTRGREAKRRRLESLAAAQPAGTDSAAAEPPADPATAPAADETLTSDEALSEARDVPRPIGPERLRALREAIRNGTYPSDADVLGGLVRLFGRNDSETEGDSEADGAP